ncbi:peroxide stress protein YaaA [Actinomyces sp.]|uniref:YaaA family protein n=1 Tax=Actinomyces sp. TaxID=29317 RepID=UPI002899E2EC|nr:peroxide stress protein YaaA [Actinomyces sp.]
MIWLPPSEGKTAPVDGPVLDLSTLCLPELTSQREEVARALITVSASPAGAEVLHLGPRSRDDLGTNVRLREAPCAPAREVFSGVLFEAAGLAVGPTPDPARPDTPEVRIFSGLFGVLGPDDPVPDHRLPMGTRLPGPGALAAYWRPRLRAALEPTVGDATVVDLRSGPYRSACPAQWAHCLRVEVQRRSAGRRSVVSHQAKHWRGLVCAALLRSGLPRDASVDECVEAVRASVPGIVAHDARGTAQRVADAEVTPTAPTRRGGSVTTLTLVVEQGVGDPQEALVLTMS